MSERRLREELAEAESALTEAQQDLDEARVEGERVTAEPLREAHERLREVGVLAQRRAVEVAEKRREVEQLDDAESEEVCASPAASSWTRPLAATTSRPGGSSRVRSRRTIRSCASCCRHGVSLSTSGARKYSSSPRISWLSRCSGLRRPSSGLSRPRRGIRDRPQRVLRVDGGGERRTEEVFAIGEEAVREVEEREDDAYGES